jgi:hypothetical protein
MTDNEARFVIKELRRMAPAAPTPDGCTSHDGRRAFLSVADQLESRLTNLGINARLHSTGARY